MKQHFNGYVALFSILCALMVYPIARLLWDARYAATAALLFALGCMLILPPVLHALVARSRRRYAPFDTMFADDLILKINVNCYFGKKVRNGWIYALPDRLCIAVCDRKPHQLIKLPYADIRAVHQISNTRFVLTCRDKRKLRFVSKNARTMVRHIQSTLLRRH